MKAKQSEMQLCVTLQYLKMWNNVIKLMCVGCSSTCTIKYDVNVIAGTLQIDLI